MSHSAGTYSRTVGGRGTALLLFVSLCGLRGPLLAQTPQPTSPGVDSELRLTTGKEIYEAACVGCHGPRGVGQAQTILGFEPPPTFPDFSDCNGSTREKTFDWKATIHEGGRGRGFSEIMPSFAEALTLDQIDKVMQYLRGLCDEPSWPLGELNLPRALVTEKAFPEDETMLVTAVNARGPGEIASELIYERRFGVRNQLELSAPFGFHQQGAHGWTGGVGDLILGYKRTLVHRAGAGSILSVQGEAIAPTGDTNRDLGSGVTTFETFAAFGQLLPRSSFLQIQAGAELPTDTDKASRAVYWRTVLGRTFAQNGGFGRSWTPMAELLADRDLETGAITNWDIVPEVQVTLNRRQHIRANIGVRTPINNRDGRPTQLLFYALWDWFDGGLRDGW